MQRDFSAQNRPRTGGPGFGCDERVGAVGTGCNVETWSYRREHRIVRPESGRRGQPAIADIACRGQSDARLLRAVQLDLSRRVDMRTLTRVASTFLANVLLFGALAAGFRAPAFAQFTPVQGATLRIIQANGIKMRIAEAGKGPLVILLHGWPESWYSWRKQIPILEQAGYHVVAPDMRGYGKTDKPSAVEDYDIDHLVGDVVGIIDAMGEKTAIVIGHDWGAGVAWACALRSPERFTAVIALSVPNRIRPTEPPVETMKRTYGEKFFYQLYFQEPGAAEAEFDADPRGLLKRVYASPDTPREAPAITDPARSAGGLIPRRGVPKALPPWLTQEDLDYYVNEFTEAGFRGGINYYRNFDRNWRTGERVAAMKVTQPALFIAGTEDSVISGASAEQLQNMMKSTTTELRGVILYPGAGHWIQQERSVEVNSAIVEFLGQLKKL